MTIKLHDRPGQVRIPDEDFELEAAADEDFMFFAVSHLSNGPLMAFKSFDRLHGDIAVDVIAMWYILEVTGNHVLLVFNILVAGCR